jgi:hypothetical protein
LFLITNHIRSAWRPKSSSRATYQRLCETYPETPLFAHMPKLGNKYSLSESNNGSAYRRLLKTSSEWRELHDYVKSREFIEHTPYTGLVFADGGGREPGSDICPLWRFTR